MRKTTKLFLGFTAGLLLLCGCSVAEEKLGYENADVAKEALASASSVRMRCDLDNVDASGNIYADEKAAAYMKNSGLFDQTWTISISGEEWFHMKIVTDEEINKMTKSATTYAFYDPDNNLLGYAQERVTTPDQMPEAYYIIFLDADLNEKPYYASEDGHTIYTEGGTVIGSAKKEMDWSGSQCNLYVNLEDNGTQVMDFQDKYALLDMMYDEANEALTSAETIEIYFDLYGSKRKTKIVADGKVAGYLQKNTVYINEEEWFSIDYVEDEPINDREGSGTTYGYYDASGTCLGYAQEQYVDTSYGKDTRLIFLDVDETPLDYQSSRSGRILYDENDEEIGSGKIGRSGVSLLDQWYTNLYCAVFKTETDGTRQIDFMDRMAMLWRLERDYRSIDDNPVNTGVQIYETVAVVFVLILLIGSSFSKWRQKKKN